MVEFAFSMLPSGDFLQKILQKIPTIYKKLSVGAVLHLPLIVEGEILGLFEFSGSDADTFTPAQISSLESVARQTATIIGHQRTVNALRYSEALYVSLVENIPLNIFRKDREGRFTFANQNYCKAAEKTLDEVLGKTDFDLHPPDLAQKYRQDDWQVIESGEVYETVEEYQPLGKSSNYVRTKKLPLYDNAGLVVGIQGIFEDITAQKENETRLQLYSERLNNLHKIDQAILAAQSLEDVAQAALEPIFHLLPSNERSSVVLFNFENNSGLILAALGAGKAHLDVGKQISLDDYPAYQRYLKDPSQISFRFEMLSKSSVAQTLRDNNIVSSLTFMLKSGNRLLGAMNIGFTNADDISPEYRTVMDEVATSLSVALRQQAQTQQIKTYAELQTRLLQEVDHRVKNNLASIVGMVYLELRFAKQNDIPVLTQTLERLNVRVRSLAAVHEMLARNEWRPIHLRSLASEVINTALRSLIPAGKELMADIGQSDILITPEHAQDFALIFTEMIENVVQFAMTDRDKLTVHLSFEEKEEFLHIVYRVNDMLHPKSIINETPETQRTTLLAQTIEHTLHGKLEILNDGDDALIIIRVPLELFVGIETSD